MQNSIWWMLLAVAMAGAVGGFINALRTGEGFTLPAKKFLDGHSVLVPGGLGNILIGAVAAVVSWGLYGPLNSINVISFQEVTGNVGLSLASLAGAVLVGIGGAGWLSAESENRLKNAAAREALDSGSPEAASKIAMAPTRADVLKVVSQLQHN